MNNLYEALEVCLKEIEQGADVETVLSRYPDLADELRPILETSVKAKVMAVRAPSQDVMRRNRAKVLQHAAEMREGMGGLQARRIWSVPLQRALVTFVVVFTLFISGTGLVQAASNTLPGDNLYPVKRTWEGIRLFLTFDLLEREALEMEHENERLEELYELFAMGRSAEVDFAGYVTRQNGNEWRVSGITVLLSTETRLPDQQVTIGAAVRVRGQTQGDQLVLAERIELLSSGIKLPEVEDNENSNQSLEDDSGEESEGETPKVEATKTPKPEFKPEMKSFEGVVSSIKNNIIVVNSITMDLSLAEEIKGTPGVGVVAKVEGYYDANGVFIVIKIEFKNESSGDESGSNSNGDDGNDDDGDDNDNEDDNDGDNSGSDGGGDDNGDDDDKDDGDNSNDSDDDD